MSTITIPVQADPDTGTLTVNDDANGYQLDVSKKPSSQTIQWDLQLANGQSGGFNALNAANNPGFAWTYEAPPAPSPPGFSPATAPSAIAIQVVDDHTQYSNNDGTWTYQLCATVNDTLCQTNPPSAGGVPGDPKIHNK